MTLRGKLTLTATATVAAATLIVSIGLYVLVARALARDVSAALLAQSRREARVLRRQGHLEKLKGTQVAVLAADGAVVRGAWPKRLPRPPARPGGRLLVYRVHPTGGALFRRLAHGRWLAVARNAPGAALTLRRIVRYGALLDLLAVLAAALASWAVAGEVLSPLRRVSRMATEIARSGQIDRRLGRIGSGEMGDLARAFDAMLDRLAHALSQLRQLAERERRFSAEAAHVLRNPLSTVLLSLEYLRRRLPEGSEEAKAAQDAHGEGQRLLRLTESLLRLARGESVSGNAESLDFGAVVEEAADVAAKGRGRPPAQRDVPRGVQVRGDRAALFGMVEGIVDNAFKYSAPTEPVRVALVADRGLVRLTVEDHGQGIPQDHLAHVFERFYRGKGEGEGSGLGLAIARAVATAHGGRIRIDSEERSYTRVTVELPETR